MPPKGKKGKGPNRGAGGRISPGHGKLAHPAQRPPSQTPSSASAPSVASSSSPIAIPGASNSPPLPPPSYQEVMREKARALLYGGSPGDGSSQVAVASQEEERPAQDARPAPTRLDLPGEGQPAPSSSSLSRSPHPASPSIGPISPALGAISPSMGAISPSTSPLDGPNQPAPELKKRDSFKQRLGDEWEAAKKKLLPADSPPTGKVNIDKARDKAMAMDLKALADAQISEILQHRQTIQEQAEELAARKARLDQTRDEMNAMHAQLKGKDASIAELEAAVQGAHAERARALKEVERARNEAKQLKEDAAELPKLKNDSARRAAEIEALTTKLSTQEFEARHARLELARTREELSGLRAAVGHAVHKGGERDGGASLENVGEDVRQLFARQEAEIKRLSTELEAAVQQAGKVVMTVSGDTVADAAQLHQLETKVAGLEAEREVWALRLKRLEKELKEKEKEVAFVRDRDAREMKTMSEEIVRQKKELNEVRGKLAVSESSRGGVGPTPDARRGSSARDSEQDRQLAVLQREMAVLSETHVGAVRSLTLERDGLAAKCNQLRDELAMMTAQMKRRTSTASNSSPEGNRGAMQEELDRLRARVAGLEKELQEASARRQAELGAKERLQREAKDARDTAEAAMREAAELRKAAAAHDKAAAPKRTTSFGAGERWEKEAEELRVRLVPLEKEVLKLRLENARLLEALDEAGREPDAPKEGPTSAASVAALQRELKKLKGWLEARDDELARVAKRTTAEKEEIARLGAELRKVKGEAAAMGEEADRARRQLAGNKDELAKLKGMLAKRSDELAESELAAKRVREEVATLQEQLRKAKVRRSVSSESGSVADGSTLGEHHRVEMARLAEQAERRRAEAEAVKLEAEVVKREVAALRAALEDASRVSKLAQSDLLALRGKLSEQDAALAAHKKHAERELAAATAASSTATAEVRRLQQELECLKTAAAAAPPVPATTPPPSSEALAQMEQVLEGYMEANARLGVQLRQQSGAIASLESRLAHAHAQLQAGRGDRGDDVMSEPGAVALDAAADLDSTSLALAVALDPAGSPIKPRPAAPPASSNAGGGPRASAPATDNQPATPVLSRAAPSSAAPGINASGVTDAAASTGRASSVSRLGHSDLDALASVVAEAVRVSKALNNVSIAESRASREVAARKQLRAALAAEKKAREEAVRAEHAARAEAAALRKELRRLSRTMSSQAPVQQGKAAETLAPDHHAHPADVSTQHRMVVRCDSSVGTRAGASTAPSEAGPPDGDASEMGQGGPASLLGSETGAYGAALFGGVPGGDASAYDVLENPLWDTTIDRSLMSEVGGLEARGQGDGSEDDGDGDQYSANRIGRVSVGRAPLGTTWQYLPATGWLESPLLPPRMGLDGDPSRDGPSWLDLSVPDASAFGAGGRSERGWAGVGGGGGANLMVLSEVVAEHMLQRWRDLDESLWELGSNAVTSAASNAGEGSVEGGSRRGRGHRSGSSSARTGSKQAGGQVDTSLALSNVSLDVIAGVTGGTGGGGGSAIAPPLGLEVEAIEVLRAQLLRSMEADCAKLEAVMKAERAASELATGAAGGQLYGGAMDAVAAGSSGGGRVGDDNKGPIAVSSMLALVHPGRSGLPPSASSGSSGGAPLDLAPATSQTVTSFSLTPKRPVVAKGKGATAGASGKGAAHRKRWIVEDRWVQRMRAELHHLRKLFLVERERCLQLLKLDVDRNWMLKVVSGAVDQKRVAEQRLAESSKEVERLERVISLLEEEKHRLETSNARLHRTVERLVAEHKRSSSSDDEDYNGDESFEREEDNPSYTTPPN